MEGMPEPTTRMRERFWAWVLTRPLRVQVVAGQFPPWQLYLMRHTGRRVVVVGYSEEDDPAAPVLMIVVVLAHLNLLPEDVHVGGVPPDALEPCAVPTVHELAAMALPRSASVH